MSIAVVTGATAGIGREFVRQLAADRLDLVLVARTRDRLDEVAEEALALGAGRVDVIAADLSERDGMAVVESRLADATEPVDLLVNNAGFGTDTPFAGSDIDAEQRQLDVLVTAVMRLTHAVVPVMVARGHGSVINVSSVAGWIPGGTYSAAKAWCTVFTESLAQQLSGTGVHLTAVCPGFTHTEFHQRAGMDVSTVPDVLWLDAADVVATALRDVRRGRAISVPGLPYKGLSLLTQYLPRPVVRRVAGGARAVRR